MPVGSPSDAAVSLIEYFSSRGLTVSLAESCTGGLVAELLTDIPGSSMVLWGGVVAYSNECKIKLLGVERATIERHGAVSEEAAREMSSGMLRQSGADMAIGITGIAGPSGGSVEKPVGLVWFGWARTDGSVCTQSIVFPGGRNAIRLAAAEHALVQALALVAGEASLAEQCSDFSSGPRY